MSVEATTAAWARPGLTSTEKLVLVRIADHASPDGGEAWPSVGRLMRDTCLSERAVQCAIKSLEVKGALSRQIGKGPHGTNRYHVTMTPPQHAPPAVGAPPQHAPLDPAARAGDPPQDVHPNRHRNRKEPSIDVQAVFDVWRESTGKSRSVLDAKRKRLIAKALKEHPVDDVLDAVKGWKFSPWHRGENGDGKVYNDLGLLLRDAAKIEYFRDCARSGGNSGYDVNPETGRLRG